MLLGLVAMLAASCAGEQGSLEPEGEARSLAGPVVDGTAVYTPIDVSEEGCVLYNIRILGGRGPAALVYRSVGGEFSYAPLSECVRTKPGQECIQERCRRGRAPL